MSPAVLVASHYTVAGPVRPLQGEPVSPIDPRERIAAASAAGFAGIGFEYHDLIHWSSRLTAADIAAAARDAGMVHVEIEVLDEWYLGGERRNAADERRDKLLVLGEKIGARLVKVLGGLDRSGAVPAGAYAEGFAELCRQAAAHSLEVAIELYPDSPLHEPISAAEIVRQAGEPNGGLLIDNWHMWRGGVPMADIAALPATMIKHVELSDGPAELVGSMLEDTLLRRRLPGEGAFPIDEFLRAISATGYAGAYGVEIISEHHRALPVGEAAALAYRAGRQRLASTSTREFTS